MPRPPLATRRYRDFAERPRGSESGGSGKRQRTASVYAEAAGQKEERLRDAGGLNMRANW